MSANDACSIDANNPDISGVGVRISFYLQTFLLVLLVDRSWRDAPISLWTFIATSFGLSISAIIQAREGQLSFFQALQVSNLVWLANFGTFLALASYSRYKAKEKKEMTDHHVKSGAMSQTLFSMALTLYMWSNPARFGNQQQCLPYVRYVLFVIDLPALGAGKSIALAITSILTAVYLIITFHELYLYRKKRKAHERAHSCPASKKTTKHHPYSIFPPPATPSLTPHSAKPISNQHPSSVNIVSQAEAKPASVHGQATETQVDHGTVHSRTPSVHGATPSIHCTAPSIHATEPSVHGTVPSIHGMAPSVHGTVPSIHGTVPSAHGAASSTHGGAHSSKSKPHRTKRQKWFQNMDPMFVGLMICQAVVFTYFIVSSELLIWRNSSADNSTKQWGFGQVMSLIVITPSAFAVVNAFGEHGVARKEEHTRKHAQKKPPPSDHTSVKDKDAKDKDEDVSVSIV